MAPIRLNELIKGLMVVIAIALASGEYNELERFARREFIASLKAINGHYFPKLTRTIK